MKKFSENDAGGSVKQKSRTPAFLVIRLHAAGDAALTLPACASLRKLLPGARIDYFCANNVKGLVSAFDVFDNVYIPRSGFEITGRGYGRISQKALRLSSVHVAGLMLRKNNYDAVIDLQNNKYSRIVRRLAGAKRYAEFNRYDAKPHSQRVIETFHRAGFEEIKNDFTLNVREEIITGGEKLLNESGWDRKSRIIVLNPAGLYETRKWGTENYCSLGEKLIADGYTLLILGTGFIKTTAGEIKKKLGDKVIDLTGKTRMEDIPGILKWICGIVSDDSGLFHIAWAMRKPGVLLLGSTRSDWTCQPGTHTVCLNSSDLECGNCMKEICRWGDNRCLTRYEPELVFKKLIEVTGKN